MQLPTVSRRLLLSLVLVAATSSIGCGQPVTIATWLNIEPGSEIQADVFGQTFTIPIEGGVFTVIELDLSDPLHVTGTIDAQQVRIAGEGPPFGALCIRKDISSPVQGTLSFDVPTFQQDVDFPLAVLARSSLLPTELAAVGSPAPGSINFPLDPALLDPILAEGALGDALELPLLIEQDFELSPGFSIPTLIDLTLRSSGQPPMVSGQLLQNCADYWPLSGDELDYVLHPRGTYLHTFWDHRRAPLAIDLAELGAGPGDVLRLSRKGSFQDGVLVPRNRIAAVFSENGDLRPDPIGWRWVKTWWIFGYWVFDPSRVRDAVDAGDDVGTPRTYYIAQETDIPEDFEVRDQTDVVVPDGAGTLFLTPIDNLFQENLSFDLRVGVEVNP